MALRSLFDVPAPAKLNLYLRVVGRRADGYHLIDSAMVPIDWCDTLHFERRGDGTLARHDLGNPLPEDDLCLRAARALRSVAGLNLGADISIEKRVPSGAGMGGGSSDAATTLLALNRLWGLDWPLERLLPIGLSLGADVPFFLGGAPARVSGIGEVLTPFAHSPQAWAVVKPAAGLATRVIFGHPAVAAIAAAARIAGFSERRPELERGNDLEAAAESLCPDVTEALTLLRTTCGESRMTGSGSAVFAPASRPDGTPVALLLPLPEGWQGRVCRSLARHPLQGWARRA